MTIMLNWALIVMISICNLFNLFVCVVTIFVLFCCNSDQWTYIPDVLTRLLYNVEGIRKYK